MLRRKSPNITHAEKEFELLAKKEPGHIVLGFKKEILAVIRKLTKSGLSYMAAPYYYGAIAETLTTLCRMEPLLGAEDIPEDWVELEVPDVDTGREPTLYHRRCSGLFKRGGRAFYSNAIVWVQSDKVAFTGTVEGISSQQAVPSWPFFPKTFFVDVTKADESGEHKIAIISQLKTALDYYKGIVLPVEKTPS